MIKYLQVTIYPGPFEISTVLDIEIEVDGKIHQSKTIFMPDEFRSRFDQVFDRAKRAILENIESDCSAADFDGGIVRHV